MVVDGEYLKVILFLSGPSLLKHEQSRGLKSNMSTMCYLGFKSSQYVGPVAVTFHCTHDHWLAERKPAPLISIISLSVFKQEDRMIRE